MKTYIAIVVMVVLCSSCGQKMNEEYVAADATDPTDAQEQLAKTPEHDVYSDGRARLIKTVDFRFEVAEVKKSTEAIEAAVKKYPAYISSTELLLENPILENKMTIKVQSEYFYDLLKEIDQQATFVNSRNVKTSDVSKEFVDLESRLKTKREVEARYTQILRSKAGTIEELLDAEQKIGALHEEIESTVSRINHLKDQVSYSTINLEFYQTITQELTAEVPWGSKLKDALGTGWEGVLAVVIGVAYLWPLIVLVTAAVLGFRYWKRRKQLVINQ
jgi:hypothetical protein